MINTTDSYFAGRLFDSQRYVFIALLPPPLQELERRLCCRYRRFDYRGTLLPAHPLTYKLACASQKQTTTGSWNCLVSKVQLGGSI
jgi:hypothetical protein